MAGAAVIHDADMIKGRGYKARGLVAVAAIAIGWHMVRWRDFSSGGCTIVARRTVINDALVIEPGISKGRGNMAHRAIIGGRNMGGVDLGSFAGCRNSIVARGAVINNACMIKHRGGKSAGHVTDTAILVCCNVGRIDLGILAYRYNPIMTGVAAFTRNFGTGMIHKSACEISRVMARPAILCCALMNWRSRRPSGPNGDIIHIAIMTRGTIAADTRVRKNRWCECSDCVTNVTILNRGQMACRPNSIWVVGDKLTNMTTFTTTVDFLMFTSWV